MTEGGRLHATQCHHHHLPRTNASRDLRSTTAPFAMNGNRTNATDREPRAFRSANKRGGLVRPSPVPSHTATNHLNGAAVDAFQRVQTACSTPVSPASSPSQMPATSPANSLLHLHLLLNVRHVTCQLTYFRHVTSTSSQTRAGVLV
jgi:hypothetical protein